MDHTELGNAFKNIHILLRKKLKIKGENIHGCLVLPNNHVVFSCHDTQLRIINKDGSKVSKIKLKDSRVFDVGIINQDTCVASGGGGFQSTISIIDLESKLVKKTISVNCPVYGIAVLNNMVYFCAEYYGLRALNLDDDSESVIIDRRLPGVYHVAAFRNGLYYTNNTYHTVTRCDLHGKAQWEFKDLSVLKEPLGIDVDNDGNVYVAGCFSQNVVVISSDGQCCKQLFVDNGLWYPQVLEYDRSENQLIVFNSKHAAFLFDLVK